MRRIVQLAVAAALVVGPLAGAGRADDPSPLRAPDAVGDQVVFYYDTRADFTTFLTLRNVGGDELTVSLLFYGPTFSTPFSKAVTLASGALTIVDIGSLRGSGLPAQPGVVLATAVDLLGRPVVTRALTGNLTVANLLTGSAFGAPGAARSAVQGDGDPPDRGTVINGTRDAAFQPIRPSVLTLAAYYDPATLAPVANSGNQLIFISFEDDYDPTYKAVIGSTTWDVSATRANGSGIGDTTFTANGVTVSDLASVAGPGVNGAAGSMTFSADADPSRLSRMIYFTESLGTFGTGYLLPPVVNP